VNQGAFLRVGSGPKGSGVGGQRRRKIRPRALQRIGQIEMIHDFAGALTSFLGSCTVASRFPEGAAGSEAFRLCCANEQRHRENYESDEDCSPHSVSRYRRLNYAAKPRMEPPRCDYLARVKRARGNGNGGGFYVAVIVRARRGGQASV